MAESGFRGKSMKSVAVDVAEGYVSVNPLFLKKFDKDMVKELYENLNKTLTSTRNEKLDLTNQFSYSSTLSGKYPAKSRTRSKKPRGGSSAIPPMRK